MLSYYPAIKPYRQDTLAVGDPHELYFEECGNPEGIPILFVHGGPGAGCTEDHRRYFDPNIYRIILFDQRGSGQSTPHANLTDNTTQALVSDMEKLREHLGIEVWVLFGGSWGSTLSLVYAETHPERVIGMILRGVFLNRRHDVDWLFNGAGANFIFPDYWEEFINAIPNNHNGSYVDAYHKILTGTDELARMSAAKAWATWEARCSTLEPDPDIVSWLSEPHMALSLSRIECHYFVNHCFLRENQILEDVEKISNIPGIIVHGRYDIVCSLENAWQLHRVWPNAQLHIIRDAGHASIEPGIVDALVRATQEMSEQLQ